MNHWNGLLPTHATLRAMPSEDLQNVEACANNNIHALAHGVSAIGNLLACTASNKESGLNVDAVMNIGFMLETLGNLISQLVDVEDNAEYFKQQGAAQ